MRRLIGWQRCLFIHRSFELLILILLFVLLLFCLILSLFMLLLIRITCLDPVYLSDTPGQLLGFSLVLLPDM